MPHNSTKKAVVKSNVSSFKPKQKVSISQHSLHTPKRAVAIFHLSFNIPKWAVIIPHQFLNIPKRWYNNHTTPVLSHASLRAKSVSPVLERPSESSACWGFSALRLWCQTGLQCWPGCPGSQPVNTYSTVNNRHSQAFNCFLQLRTFIARKQDYHMGHIWFCWVFRIRSTSIFFFLKSSHIFEYESVITTYTAFWYYLVKHSDSALTDIRLFFVSLHLLLDKHKFVHVLHLTFGVYMQYTRISTTQ